jgi:RHS repeat-associated protein
MTTGLLNGSGSGQFEYDGANQLIRTQATATSDPTRYAYDAFGRRIAKVTYPNGSAVASAVTLFLYEGWNLIAEYKLDSGAWTLDRTYTWGLDLSGSTQGAGGVGGLLSVTKHEAQATAPFYPIYDGNGNIEAYLDSNGAPAAIYQYDAFGNILSGGGKGDVLEQAKFSHRFSTKYQDLETALLYYGYRYYHTLLGRWLNRDPIGEEGGLNLQGMVGNDPLSMVDAFGLTAISAPEGLIGSKALVEALAAMEASLAAAMAKVAALNPGAVVPAAGVGGVGLTAAGAGALFIALQTLKDQEWIAGVCQSQINCTFALAAAGGFIATLDLAEVALDHALGENSNPAADVALQGLRVSVEGLTQLGFVIAKVCPESAALFTAMIGQKVAKARNRIEQASARGGGSPTKTPTPTTKDSPFGPKIADEVPKSGVPDNWSKSDIDDAIVDYKASLETRRREFQTFEELGEGSATLRTAHARRISEEEGFLKSLEKVRESRR